MADLFESNFEYQPSAKVDGCPLDMPSTCQHPRQWFVMRVTYSRELKAQSLFRDAGVRCYIPMRSEHTEEGERYVPAVHNLLFVHTSRQFMNQYKRKMEEVCPLRYMIDRRTGLPMVVLLPPPRVEAPAIVLELKWNGSADAAIAQIKRQEYAGALSGFAGEVLLVGINYNKRSKRHECRIERWEKTQVARGKNSSSKREISRSKKIDKIVEFCSEPKSLEEIAAFMGKKDKNFMKMMYIDPVLDTRLRMTGPHSPNSPTQKYVRISNLKK